MAKSTQPESQPEVKPVKLVTTGPHKLRNDFGILYSKIPQPCLDLNAPDAYFERANLEAGVLAIYQEPAKPEPVEETSPTE